MEPVIGRQAHSSVLPGTSAPQRTADVLVDILISAGVEVVFGLPGGPISPIHDALIDRSEVRVLTTRHESGALFAAAGYAQTSGKIGVVLVTSGPGVLNALTGLASAYCDGLPLLVLVGEVPRKNQGRGALQDGSAHGLNIVEMASHITKLAAQVAEPNAAPAMLRRAIATALSGRRGPVVLTLPMDTTLAKITAPQVHVDVMTAKIDADQLLTSHQVGALLQVNPSSVKKWVNEGRIAAFRTPGGHRRIRAADLVEFLDVHKMPIPRPLANASKRRLLVVDDNSSRPTAGRGCSSRAARSCTSTSTPRRSAARTRWRSASRRRPSCSSAR